MTGRPRLAKGDAPEKAARAMGAYAQDEGFHVQQEA